MSAEVAQSKRQATFDRLPLAPVQDRVGKVTAQTLDLGSSTDDTLSSPQRIFSSSPALGNRHTMDHEQDAFDGPALTSNATTVASDEEDETESTKIVRRPANKLILSDDEESDEDEDEDDMTFLNRFRQRHAMAAQGDGPASVGPVVSTDADHLQTAAPRHSSTFSGTLSDPPTIDSMHGSAPIGAVSNASLQPANLSSIPSSSEDALSQPRRAHEQSRYTTEAQSRASRDQLKTARLEKVKQLAARARQSDTTHDEGPQEDQAVHDHLTSSSEVEDDDDDLPSSMSKIVPSRGEQRPAGTSAMPLTRTLNVAPEDDDSDLDLEWDAPAKATASTSVPRPLSKKEQAEMARVQARIEREKRITVARAVQKQRQRQTFHVQDLLARFSEDARKTTIDLTNSSGSHAAVPLRSPSSDPIETDSEPERDSIPVRHNAATARALLTVNKEKVVIRPRVPRKDELQDDEDLPDADAVVAEMGRERAQQERWKAWQEEKMAAMRDFATRPTLSTAPADDDDDDDLEFYDATEVASDKSRAAQTSAAATMLLAPQSPNGRSNGDASDDEADVTVTQIHRAGQALAQKGQKASDASKDGKATSNAQRKGKVAHKAPSTMSKQDLQTFMVRQIEQQNLQIRMKRTDNTASHGGNTEAAASGQNDVGQMIAKLQQEAQARRLPGDADVEEEDEEGSDDDSDFAPGDSDGEAEQPDYGSGAEDFAVGSEQEDAQEEESVEDSEDETPDPQSDIVDSVGASSLLVIDQEEDDVAMATASDVVRSRAPKRLRIADDEDEEEEAPHAMPLVDMASISSPAAIGFDIGSPVDFAEFFAGTPEADGGDGAPAAPAASLGQFFEDTQPNAPLRGESFSVLPGVDATGNGFTQLFEQGTLPPASSTAARGAMLPPTTSAKGLLLIHGSDRDGFAALRKAQQSAALVLDDEPSDLPDLDQILRPGQEDENLALELEAMRAEEEERQGRLAANSRGEHGVTYINRDGFFTQTRPTSYSFNMSQSQTQEEGSSQMPISTFAPAFLRDLQQSTETMHEADESPVRPIKRRFRLAAEVDAQAETETGPSKQPKPRDIMPSSDLGSETAPETSSPPRAATVFDRLRQGVLDQARQEQQREQERARRQFVEGEAEESDGESEMEEDGVRRPKQRQHGGLQGVFSDDEQGSADEEEDEDEDQDGDLEGLIDEERDEDEAEKDMLARQRYMEDMDQDDRAAQAMHERAIRGGFRTKRRARNQDGALEGFLEEDFEEDWLEKVARNPYGNIAKKRRLEGKDGMDLLAEKEESQAFVREYHDSHQDTLNADAYAFLARDDEDEEPEEEDDQASGDESLDKAEGNQGRPQKRISRLEIQEAIAERRRAKRLEARRLHAIDDELEAEERRRKEEEEQRRERQLQRNIEKALYHGSDDEDDDVETQADLAASTSLGASNRGLRSLPVDAAADGEVDAFDDPLLSAHRSTSDRERQRMARLAKEYEHEPDWQMAKQSVQQRRRGAAVKAGNAMSRTSTSTFTSSSSHGPRRIPSRLQGVMSRQSQFSEQSQ